MFASGDTVFVGDAVADEDRFTTLAHRRRPFDGGSYDRGGCRGCAADVEGDEGFVHFHHVAHVAVQRDDGALVRARQFDGRLSGFDVDQGLVQDDRVADVHLPGHDLGLDETFADVGQQEDLFAQLSNSITRSTASRMRSTVGR